MDTENKCAQKPFPGICWIYYLSVTAAAFTIFWTINSNPPKPLPPPEVPEEKEIIISKLPDLGSIPDFSSITDINEKKSAFFRFMTPIVASENRKVLEKRKQAQELFKKYDEAAPLSQDETTWLTRLAAEYSLDHFHIEETKLRTRLLKRVDGVPVFLALSQSANETAWGTSRFAREGNNMFGQWSYKKGSGMVPLNREPGKDHEVAKFDSVNDSIKSYIHNLNTNRAYAHFRELRRHQRDQGEIPDGETLAAGLDSYSERGEDYIREIRSMIKYNTPLMNQNMEQGLF